MLLVSSITLDPLILALRITPSPSKPAPPGTVTGSPGTRAGLISRSSVVSTLVTHIIPLSVARYLDLLEPTRRGALPQVRIRRCPGGVERRRRRRRRWKRHGLGRALTTRGQRRQLRLELPPPFEDRLRRIPARGSYRRRRCRRIQSLARRALGRSCTRLAEESRARCDDRRAV